MKTYVVTRKNLKHDTVEMDDTMFVGRTEVDQVVYFAEIPLDPPADIPDMGQLPTSQKAWVPNPLYASKMSFEEAAIVAYKYRSKQKNGYDKTEAPNGTTVEYGVSRLTYQVEDVPLVVEPE